VEVENWKRQLEEVQEKMENKEVNTDSLQKSNQYFKNM
jgi:hypothetical protein